MKFRTNTVIQCVVVKHLVVVNSMEKSQRKKNICIYLLFAAGGINVSKLFSKGAMKPFLQLNINLIWFFNLDFVAVFNNIVSRCRQYPAVSIRTKLALPRKI